MSKTITFAPADWKSIEQLIDSNGEHDGMGHGTNENGEDVLLQVFDDRVEDATFQHNGWSRVNTYWKDGTIEETFDGRWKEVPKEPLL